MDYYKEKVIALLSNQELSKEQKEKLEDIFPELKESGGEKIRKHLIDCVKKTTPEASAFKDIKKEEILAWLEKQGKQKQPWEPNAAQLIVIKDLIEDKNTSKVNKVILRGMFDEFNQFTNSQSSQFSSGHLLDPDKVIEWLKHCNLSDCDIRTSIIPDSSPTSNPHRVRWLSDDFVNKFKNDFEL